MMKQEFEARINATVTAQEYRDIETVYTWYPTISEITGKDQIAALYLTHGMRIIADMLQTAYKCRDLQATIDRKRRELAQAQEDYDRAKYPQ